VTASSCHSFQLYYCGAAGTTANGHAEAASPLPSQEAEADAGPRSSEDWVEALVQQMAGAKDVDDARERASQVLQAFEQAVLRAAGPQVGLQLQLALHICSFVVGSHLLYLLGGKAMNKTFMQGQAVGCTILVC
jgi:hypothetical protein